jgi:hypothetical protein
MERTTLDDFFPATRALEALSKKRKLSYSSASSKRDSLLRPSTSDCSVDKPAWTRRSSYDLTDMFNQASATIDEHFSEFPTIEWSFDADDEDDEGHDRADRHSRTCAPPSKKYRKAQLDEDTPFLLRSKSLTTKLDFLGSSNNSLNSES